VSTTVLPLPGETVSALSTTQRGAQMSYPRGANFEGAWKEQINSAPDRR
jgi:hypothetical protein